MDGRKAFPAENPLAPAGHALIVDVRPCETSFPLVASPHPAGDRRRLHRANAKNAAEVLGDVANR